MGATASVIGQAIAGYLNVLTVIGGILIILMGLHFLGLFRLALLNREARLHVRDLKPGLIGAYGLGLAFAFGWTPCIGPVLAAILAVAGDVRHGRAKARSCSRSIRSALGFRSSPRLFSLRCFLRGCAGFRRFLPAVEKGMGAFLVLTGIAFLSGQMATISYWMLETFPGLATLG